MQESNGNQPEQSQEPSGHDFVQDLKNAQTSGDYDFVLDTARKSHAMLTNFRDTVKRSSYLGKDAAVIAQGLNFLENMVSQSAAQIDGLKRMEKQARTQMKAALTAKGAVKPAMEVVGPETPPEAPEGDVGGSDAPATPAPETPASLPGAEEAPSV